jgi:hypothetical protein
MAKDQGMPWGPKQYGQASQPNIITDPTTMKVPGIQKQVQNVRTMAGQAQGGANNAALAALQRAGVGGGSESANALGNIASRTAGATGEALAGLENEQFKQQSGLADMLNKIAMEKYGFDTEANAREDESRSNAVGGLAGGLLEALTLGLASRGKKGG